MSKKEFMGQVFISFFVVVTCINLGMAFMGMIYAPDTRFGYEALLFPVFYGFLGILPSAVLYSRKELTVKQMPVSYTHLALENNRSWLKPPVSQ